MFKIRVLIMNYAYVGTLHSVTRYHVVAVVITVLSVSYYVLYCTA